MSSQLNEVINYGGAKFKVVKNATSKDIADLQTQLNTKANIYIGTEAPSDNTCIWIKPMDVQSNNSE